MIGALATMQEQLHRDLRADGVVPVIVLERVADALPLAEALVEGGLRTFEITLRTDAALDSIESIATKYPQAMTGAGTVLTTEHVERAVGSGAQFLVSPGYSAEVVAKADELGVPIVPGVATASEIQVAYGHGLRLLKLFPAGIVGGVSFLRAVSGVFQDVEFVPTGGVSAENLPDYLSVRNVVACGGSWICPLKMVDQQAFGEIAELARQARRIVSDSRG